MAADLFVINLGCCAPMMIVDADLHMLKQKEKIWED
jgi:hypothetical protein